ncbi:MAG: hypothetical protein HZA51_09045 [Planctomycetes bacterium]|nr:hypothetical protein [Planctomycetota bacterium]
MTTDNNTTNEPADASDLLDTLTITKLERRTSAGGAWVVGTIGGYRFDALVFPEHAESESYELARSRISKFWLQRIEDRVTVFNWDRGMDIEAVTPEIQRIVDLLADGLAEHIYGV